MSDHALTNLFDDLRNTGAIPEALFDCVRSIVRNDLLRRRVWTKSPELLGYPFASWNEQGSLDALTFDALDSAVITRMKSISTRRSLGYTVDGMIVTNIRWFLYECQREADPLGRNCYACVLGAAELGVAEGWLVIVGQPQAGGMGTTVSGVPPHERDASDDEVRCAIVAAKSFPELAECLDVDGKLEDARLGRAVAALAAAIRELVRRVDGRLRLETIRCAVEQEVRAARASAECDEDESNQTYARVEIQSLFGAIENAVRSSSRTQLAQVRCLRVLDCMQDPLFHDMSDAERAQSIGMSRQRFSEHRREIQQLAEQIRESSGQTPSNLR